MPAKRSLPGGALADMLLAVSKGALLLVVAFSAGGEKAADPMGTKRSVSGALVDALWHPSRLCQEKSHSSSTGGPLEA